MSALPSRRILVLGASGLIGYAIAIDLMRRGHAVVPVARRFSAAQRNRFGTDAVEAPIARLDAAALMQLVKQSGADVIINCLGMLQDQGGESAHDIHEAFTERLIAAVQMLAQPVLLIHISIPGRESEDRTEFSRTKRNAERRIAESGLPYAILRPGLVFAPTAYGSSALLRALAALPFDLPAFENSRPLSFIAVEEVAQTVAWLVERWDPQNPHPAVKWDLMHPEKLKVGDIISGLRSWLGGPRRRRIFLPKFLLALGAKAGDLAALLGWRPPIRSTALAEMRRGVAGDPRTWMETTKIAPRSLERVLDEWPASVQEKWFARLYLLKPLIIASLVVFWCISGLIALTVAFDSAVAILVAHGFSDGLARAATIASSLADIAVGIAIAVRRTCRIGLLTGIAVSVFYMLGAAVLTPELWIEPLGALVKTVPAIVLMLVALATLDER
jgi:uncharacterized protein YbjT (DUF2867 family)